MAGQQILSFRNTVPRSEKTFQINRDAAEHSVLVRMLLEDFDEADLANAVIPLTIDVSDAGQDIVFTWMQHNRGLPKATDGNNNNTGSGSAAAATLLATADPDPTSFSSVAVLLPGPVQFSAWDRNLFDGLDSDLLYEVLVASNYLDVKPLYDRACAYVAYLIRGQTAEQIRYTLGITGDFTPPAPAY